MDEYEREMESTSSLEQQQYLNLTEEDERGSNQHNLVGDAIMMRNWIEEGVAEGDEGKKKKLRKISGFEESEEGAWENKVVPLLSCMKEMQHHLYRKNDDSALDALDHNKLNHLVFVCSYVSDKFRYYQDGPIFPPALLSACLDLYTYRDDFELFLVTKVVSADNFECNGIFHDYMVPFPLSSLVVSLEDSERRTFMCDLVLGPPPDPEEFERGQGFDYKCLLVNIAEKTLFFGQPGGSMSSVVGHLEELLSSSSFDAQHSYHRLCKTMWPLNSCLSLSPPRHPPISRIFENVKPEYSDADLLSELPPIEIGQKLDVKLLLCAAGGSNELLLRKNGEQVELGKAIEGKYTMLCCFHAPIFGTDDNSMVVQSLVTTCSELYAQGMNFEMVVVVKIKKLADYKQVFDHFLSGFPSSCLVIPFEDSKRRDSICKYLQLDDDVQCLLLDSNSNILLHGFPEFAWYYGADAFPFTDDKLQALEAEEEPAWVTRPADHDLMSLLRCKPSHVLKKTNNNAEVDQDGCDHSVMTTTISDLSKNDVVGLYLCINGDAFPKLKEVYEQCKIQQKPFEVLLVYVPSHTCHDPHNFKLCVDDLLQKHELSLWYMPFDNSVSHKLSRLTGVKPSDQLLIFFRDQQGALFIDRCGRKMIGNCGIDAYPFIRKQLVAREWDRITKLTLETLLVYKERTYVLKNNEQVPVADLNGRNIFLFFGSLSDYDMPIVQRLFFWYKGMKEKSNSGFEVVFVLKDKSEVAGEDLEDSVMSAKMPWLVCPFDAEHSAFVKEELDPNFFVEFGEDGLIRSLRAERLLYSNGLIAETFPSESSSSADRLLDDGLIAETFPSESSSSADRLLDSDGLIVETFPSESSSGADHLLDSDGLLAETFPSESSSGTDRLLDSDGIIAETFPFGSSFGADCLLDSDGLIVEPYSFGRSLSADHLLDSYGLIAETVPLPPISEGLLREVIESACCRIEGGDELLRTYHEELYA